MINPEEDGITHINIYSKARTKLGKLLSNFAPTPFICEDGEFISVEGYWYWLLTDHPDKNKLRTEAGFWAKQTGRELGAKDWPDEKDEKFKEKIKKAITAKIYANKEIRKQLAHCTLPFKHYYVYGDLKPKIVEVKGCEWMLDHMNEIRNKLVKNSEDGQ